MEKISPGEKNRDTVTQERPSVNAAELGGSSSTFSISQPSEGEGESKRHLVKAAGIMGIMTLCSRVLGMIRDIVSAKSFGTSWQWDAFLYSFMLPNFFRRLIGEGTLSSAFIPVYSEILHQKGEEEAFRFANVTWTILAAGLTLFLFFMELILNTLLKIPTLSPTLHLTVDLLRVMFPYLWFMSLFALGMGILNSHRHFFAPSLGPITLDIAWIAGVLWLTSQTGQDFSVQVKWLAVVIFLSGAVQLAIELPPLYRMGFRLRWVWDVFYPGLKKTVRLFLPTLLAFAVVQINLLVDATLGLAIGAGANSSLWYGNRLMQFPLGIFAIAMGTALLPTIARQTALQEMEAAKKTLSFALRSIFLIILPSSVGLIVLRAPVVQLLFERGQFDALSTARTASVLMCYSFGLFAYSGQKIITAGFYAVQDTRTPVKIGVLAVALNLILNLILMIPLAESGLALATSFSGMIQFLLLTYLYHRKVAKLDIPQLSLSFTKIAMASAVMGVTCRVSYPLIGSLAGGKDVFAMLVRVGGTMGIGIISYTLFCFLFRVDEMREALDWLLRRRIPVKPNGELGNGGMSEA
jgi:putative peptidoglycan lipid II flippase